MKTGKYNYKYGDESYWIGPWEYTNWTYNMATGGWSPNPGLEPELITNGNMETGNPPTGWGATNVTILGVADESTGGSGVQSLSLTNTGAAVGYSYINTSAGINNKWLRLELWAKIITPGTSLKYALTSTAAIISSISLSPAIWTNYTSIGPNVDWTDATLYLRTNRATLGDEVRFDRVSIKPLVSSHLCATRNFGRQVGFGAQLSLTSKLPMGIVSKATFDANGVLQYGVRAWHDGTNIYLDKIVNYVPISLINTAAIYTQWKNVIIKHPSADVAQLWYGTLGVEAQVGANQDCSAVPVGTRAGFFGTDQSGGAKNLQVYEVGA